MTDTYIFVGLYSYDYEGEELVTASTELHTALEHLYNSGNPKGDMHHLRVFFQDGKLLSEFTVRLPAEVRIEHKEIDLVGYVGLFMNQLDDAKEIS